MFIFLVDYWMPKFDSEYGGLQCVVAENEDQVIKILSEFVSEYYQRSFPDYKEMIAEEVKRSKRFKLDSSVPFEYGIVKEFIT